MLESAPNLSHLLSRVPYTGEENAGAKPITIMKSLLSLRRMEGFDRLLKELSDLTHLGVLPSLRPQYTLEILISQKQVTPAQLAILRHLHYSPIIVPCVKQLAQEFEKLQQGALSFKLLNLSYGLNGVPSRSKMEAALTLGLTLKELDEHTATLRRQLATTAIRGILLDSFEHNLEEFLASSLYLQLCKRNICFLQATGEDTQQDSGTKTASPISNTFSGVSPAAAKNISIDRDLHDDQLTTIENNNFDFTPPPKRLWQIAISKIKEGVREPARAKLRGSDFEELLATLMKEKKVIFSGPPGSGKSTLARELALTLAKSGKRTALLCHSKFNVLEHQEALKNEMEGQENIQNQLTITTYHSLCISCGKAANIPIPRTRTNYVFNQAFPKILTEAMEANSHLKYEAIIVDEGHSLHANMLHTLNTSLTDIGETYLALFQDDAMIPQHFQENAINAQAHLFLKNSFRPVKRLLETNETLEAYEVFSRSERNETLSAVLRQLICLQGESPGDIALLSLKKELILNRLELPDKLRLRQSPGNKPNSIFSGSVFGFRSSCKPIVIVSDLGEFIHEAKPAHIETFKHIIFGRASRKLIFLCDQFSLSSFLPENQQVLRLDSYDFLGL
jgi:hypothetical protein